MSDLVVRFAGQADRDWCVYTATFDSDHFVQQLPGISEVIVAEREGQLVGMLHLTYIWPGHKGGVPYISLVNVIREHQRQGIGKEMLAFVEHYLRAHGHTLLISSCVVDEHEPQAWHRHVGFVECGYFAGFPFDDGRGEVFFYKRLA